MYLRPHDDFDDPFEYDMSGLEVLAPLGKVPYFMVYHVRPNSPAAEAGIEVGDQILSINFVSMGKLSLDNIQSILRKEEGKLIRLLLLRNGEKIYTEFRLKKFI
jgi:C-terminal processing protease CtpA/Prc